MDGQPTFWNVRSLSRRCHSPGVVRFAEVTYQLTSTTLTAHQESCFFLLLASHDLSDFDHGNPFQKNSSHKVSSLTDTFATVTVSSARATA